MLLQCWHCQNIYAAISAGRILIYNPHRFPSLGESGPATIAMKAPNTTSTWQKGDGAFMWRNEIVRNENRNYVLSEAFQIINIYEELAIVPLVDEPA